jgi:threonine dehydratase
VLTRDDVLAAQARTLAFVRRTPSLAGGVGLDVTLQCEFLQVTGVFKARGAFNRQLAARERGELDSAVGIAVASGGNAGLAHSYAANRLGVPACVFVPVNAPAVKVARIQQYGAQVHHVGADYAEAYLAATEYIAETGALLCHAYDQLEVAAGAGVIAEEILADDPAIDTIVVAVGGGGLFAGIAAATEGRARVVAVEPTAIPTLRAALERGEPVDVAVSGVAADSLGAKRIGSIAFEVAQRTSPVSLLVDDQQIVDARNLLWRQFRIAVEAGAAAAYAALTSGAYQPTDHERVAVILCGANTDLSTIADERTASRR